MLVEHKLTQEKFALKAIPQTTYKERHHKAVSTEIEMQARCKNCPNIVRFKEQFACEGTHFIMMEYMAGGDLQ